MNYDDPQDGTTEEQWSYEALISNICEAPATWMPAILKECLAQCEKKRVFRSHATMLEFCEKVSGDQENEDGC